MPLFATGRTWNPYAEDSPAAKRRRLEVAEDVLTSVGLPEAAGLLESAADFVDRTGDQVVPAISDSRRGSRGFRSRMPRSIFGRRRRRRRVRVSRNLARKIVKVVSSNKETKQFSSSITTNNLGAGDGTSKVLQIFNIPANLTQGDNANDIDGNVIWLKGISVKGLISSDETQAIMYRIWMIATTQTADITLAGATYGNTTTAAANPAATPP